MAKYTNKLREFVIVYNDSMSKKKEKFRIKAENEFEAMKIAMFLCANSSNADNIEYMYEINDEYYEKLNEAVGYPKEYLDELKKKCIDYFNKGRN